MYSASERRWLWVVGAGFMVCAPLAQAEPMADGGRVLLRARGQQGEIVRNGVPTRRVRLPRIIAGGVIRRAELSAELAHGVGYFLQQVQVEAKHLNGRFMGWRLLSLPQRSELRVEQLAVGDVVTRVNGLPIERPEQFLAMWQTLEKARHLTVEFERGGVLRKLHFVIR